MRRSDPASLRRSVPSAVAMLFLPTFALAYVGQLPVAEWIVLPVVAAIGPVVVAWLGFRSTDVALLVPLIVLGILVGLAAPGVTTDLLAILAAVGILLWLAVATNPRRKVGDLAAGVVVPAVGGGVALALAVVAPSEFAFVGAAATLAGVGFVVVAVIVWMLTRPGSAASPS
jgi:hypothetical protein